MIIIIIILGIAIGLIIAFPISKILIKKHKRKITDDSIGKILKQKEVNLQTADGKPVSLNFKNDGKDVDLKKQVREELAKAKRDEIRGYKEEIKEIKKSKKLVKGRKK